MKISIQQRGISKHITVRKMGNYEAQMSRIEEKFRQANLVKQDTEPRGSIYFVPTVNNGAAGSNFPTGENEADYGC